MYLEFTFSFLEVDILFIQFKISISYLLSIQKKAKSNFIGENMPLFFSLHHKFHSDERLISPFSQWQNSSDRSDRKPSSITQAIVN
jgi:hypothetical protein